MDLLDMIGGANAGSVYTHSFAATGLPSGIGTGGSVTFSTSFPGGGTRSLRGGGCSCGPSSLAKGGGGTAFPGSAYIPYLPPRPVLRSGRGCYGPAGAIGCGPGPISSLRSMGAIPASDRPGVPSSAGPVRGLSSPGSVPVQDRPGIPNTAPGISLRTLRALRHLGPNDPCVCPEQECKGCHPIFYLGTATAAIMVLALILK